MHKVLKRTLSGTPVPGGDSAGSSATPSAKVSTGSIHRNATARTGGSQGEYWRPVPTRLVPSAAIAASTVRTVPASSAGSASAVRCSGLKSPKSGHHVARAPNPTPRGK